MGLRLFTLSVFVCFLYVVNTSGSPVSDLSPEAENEFIKAINEFSDIMKKCYSEIETVSLKVNEQINLTLNHVNEESLKLRNDVYQAIKDAEEHNKDVSDCILVAEKALRNFGEPSIENCKNPRELSEATHELVVINLLRHQLVTSKRVCFNRPENVDACLTKMIEQSIQKARTSEQNVTNILKLVQPEKQGECIKKEIPALEKQIADIMKEWKDCKYK